MQGIFKQLADFDPSDPGHNHVTQEAPLADPHNIVNAALAAHLTAPQQLHQVPDCEHAFNLVNTLYRQHQGELQNSAQSRAELQNSAQSQAELQNSAQSQAELQNSAETQSSSAVPMPDASTPSMLHTQLLDNDAAQSVEDDLSSDVAASLAEQSELGGQQAALTATAQADAVMSPEASITRLVVDRSLAAEASQVDSVPDTPTPDISAVYQVSNSRSIRHRQAGSLP